MDSTTMTRKVCLLVPATTVPQSASLQLSIPRQTALLPTSSAMVEAEVEDADEEEEKEEEERVKADMCQKA